MKVMDKEFYIGWSPQAPDGYARYITRFLFILLPVVITIGLLLALSQKKFDSGNFEFGSLTTIKAIYFNKPVPMLKVIAGKDIWGNISYVTIPLVGYGKHGAEGAIANIEKEKKVTIDQKEITIQGTLLYNDGKTFMQINADEHPLISVSPGRIDPALVPRQKDLGELKVKGEIIDPKCYFGVMKPGEGKVHRDCAIRCILGGIPPVMLVRNSRGEKNYYLITGPNGEKMNEAVQDYVAEPVEITARLEQYDDWIIMKVKDNKMITRISGLRLLKNEGDIVCCGPGNLQAAIERE